MVVVVSSPVLACVGVAAAAAVALSVTASVGSGISALEVKQKHYVKERKLCYMYFSYMLT